MYSNVKQVAARGSAGASSAAAPVSSARTGNAYAYASELLKTMEHEALKAQMANEVNIADALTAESANASSGKSLSFGHSDLFTVRREMGFAGTLNDLAANPNALTYDASTEPIALPVGARAILVNTRVTQAQNTSPLAFDVKIKGIETTSKWTSSGNVDSDVHLKPFMKQPMNFDMQLFSRDLNKIDYAKVANMENLTEESIRAAVLSVNVEKNIHEIAYPSTITDLLHDRLPNLSADIMTIVAVPNTDTQIALVDSDVAKHAIDLAVKYANSAAFSDPNKIGAEFLRSDGKNINSLEGLVDAAPDLGAFQAANVASTTYHVNLTVENTYLLWYPVQNEIAAAAAAYGL